MDYMFNNCISLKTINFDFTLISDLNNMNIISSKYMFNNCISLTNIFIYKIKFSNIMNNMFSNCISLKSVVLNDFYDYGDYINISHIFYNCTSLDSLIYPSQYIDIPNDMSFSFAYCSSLKKLHLEFGYFLYHDDYYLIINNNNTMSNAFRNCSSLTSINLDFELLYEDMSFTFMGCTSLTDIETMYGFFYIPGTKYLRGLFQDCHSLRYLEYSEFMYSFELVDISYLFAGSSILHVNFSNLETTNITNYEGMFYDCSELDDLDISSFTTNNLPDLNLSIFKGSYDRYTFLTINEEFLRRIYVPSHFQIIITTPKKYNYSYGNISNSNSMK